MKALFKLFVFAFLLGGWALAASALSLVRSPNGECAMGRLTLMPKEHLTFRQTWVDTTKWTDADAAAHPYIATRLKLSPSSCPACDAAVPTQTAAAK
jgi:hypothetical protein